MFTDSIVSTLCCSIVTDLTHVFPLHFGWIQRTENPMCAAEREAFWRLRLSVPYPWWVRVESQYKCFQSMKIYLQLFPDGGTASMQQSVPSVLISERQSKGNVDVYRGTKRAYRGRSLPTLMKRTGGMRRRFSLLYKSWRCKTSVH